MARGRFIVLEGLEGAGKSTALAQLQAQLEAAGKRALVTREPGGTPLGEQLRRLLLDPSAQDMEPVTELLLVFAARKQHVAQVIKPALEAGVWVVCDRFVDSSYAYQGGGRGLASSLIAEVERLCLAGFRPDLSILLDLDPQTGLARAGQGRKADRFEQEGPAFFAAVRQAFLARAKDSPTHRLVDASQPLADVQRQLQGILAEALEDA